MSLRKIARAQIRSVAVLIHDNALLDVVGGRGNIEAATRKGTDNGRAKLDDSLVRYPRQMYIPNDREWGASAIARRLNMGVSSTHRMLTGAAWRHVV